MIRMILVSLAVLGLGFFYLWLADNYRIGCVVCWFVYPLLFPFFAWVWETGLEKIEKNY